MKKYILLSFIIAFLLVPSCKNKDRYQLIQETDVVINNIEIGYDAIIEGFVYDEATNTPIHDAVVALDINGGSTVTDSLGKFRFEYIVAGTYRLKAIKTGYYDVNTDNIIKVASNDTIISKNIPMRKQANRIKLTDLNGNIIDRLDLGSDTSTEMMAFNIVNDASDDLVCQLLYSSVWLKSVSAILHPIAPGSQETITVIIDRSKLAKGLNSTELYVTSDNGSSTLTIVAYGQ